MSNEYVWLSKGDDAYKEYKNKGWHTILSVRTKNNESYFCYAKNKHFVTEEEQNKLLVPVCVINLEYYDCIITFDEDKDDGFIWKDRRCFHVERHFIDQITNSKMGFFKGDEAVKIESISQTVMDSEIKVKSSMLQYYIFAVFISILLALAMGMYIWLF